MKKDKLNAAVKLLTSGMEGGILPLDEDTMNLLQVKHPEPAKLNPEAVVDCAPNEVHPIIFDEIDAESVKSAAMKTQVGRDHLA